MPKYILVREESGGWFYAGDGYRGFYNSIEAAVDAARRAAAGCDFVAVAEVVRKFETVSILREVKPE